MKVKATSLKGKTVCIVLLLLALYSCKNNNRNRLAEATSPYLRQHADNPVRWFEWGDEAISEATKQNKPLLVSIGYAACHWCHVMEKESFMDTAVARFMNEHFICIKVDREERPDIDNLFLHACQLISGNSGWPLNAFALPDGTPFFAGTYYSREAWLSLLKKVATAYKEQNKKVVLQARALTNGIADQEYSLLKSDSPATTLGKQDYESLFESVYQNIDLIHGGLKGSQKFPMPVVMEFFFQFHTLTGNRDALNIATNTLTRMALGGIYDHVGGGFARYATDSLWRIPHFEKMLYDNGQLLTLYSHAFQLTGNPFFKDVASEIALFIERDLGSQEGGFYSSLNADTKAGEGAFYSWDFQEIQKILGEESASLLSTYFNIAARGNWKPGKNILHCSLTPEEFAKANKLNSAVFSDRLDNAKKLLLSERNKRERPDIDDKILVSWNALALKGYIDAYAAFGEAAYLKIALANARFIEKNMLEKDDQLWRNFSSGKASIPAFLDDYAFLARAFIRLYQVTFDKHWLLIAQRLARYAVDNFYDAKTGMFYYTSAKSKKLAVQKIELSDNVLPSSNAVMAEVLYSLGVYFENDKYLHTALEMVLAISRQISSGAAYYTGWCYLTGIFSYGTREVAIMGKEAQKLNVELQKRYLPNCLFMGNTREENLPLLLNKMPAGRTLIYVCTNKTCKLPVEEVSQALEQLKNPVAVKPLYDTDSKFYGERGR